MKLLPQAKELVLATPSGGATADSVETKPFSRHKVAFVATYLFTLLLYLRPNELFPDLFGTLSIIKFVAITGIIAYVSGKLSHAEPLTVMTIEVKMVLAMAVLSLVLMLNAAAPDESWFQFNDTFSKVVVIFILMVNLLDTPKRLLSIFNLIIAGGVWVAYYAIQTYNEGEYMLIAKGISRIAGVGGGMFGNPNDLANALDMLIPLAFVLGLYRKGVPRLIYLGCVGLFVYAVLITYSRGAFLGLMAAAGFLAWRLGRGKRFKMIVVSGVAVVLLTVASPGGFGKRIATIFDVDKDQTGSSYQRRELLKRALLVAAAHPLGVGMANYHLYSLNEERAHNAYLETASELGVLGLLAYLIINFSPLIGLFAFERKLGKPDSEVKREAYYICVGLQATLVTYYVCSFFASVQYYWFLYYPVAHSVAFFRIYRNLSASTENENLALIPINQQTDIKTKPGKAKGGVLWQPNQAQAGVLWSKTYWRKPKFAKRRSLERVG
ncbi:MAG: O-antigen ligase family protein [Acidobacteria bacterium]|nr:O-antigen ligase family protein [Acidobacteriota bacterium]